MAFPHNWLNTAERVEQVANAQTAILKVDSAHVDGLTPPPLWGDGAAALLNEVPGQVQEVLDDESS